MGWMGWDGPFFLCLFIFKMISSIKLKLVSFFVARSLPYRLPSGSSANLTIEADRPSLFENLSKSRYYDHFVRK